MFRYYDPFRELDRMASARQVLGTSAHAVRFEDRLELRYDLPGVDPADIELTVEGRELTLAAERSDEVPEDGRVVWGRSAPRSFRHTVTLAEAYDLDQLEASSEHGVLVIRVPVAAASQPRKVAIGTGGAEAIEATASA